jgi:hypothetical protein
MSLARAGRLCCELIREDGVMSGYAPVNGLRTYYEVHGTGRPLVRDFLR